MEYIRKDKFSKPYTPNDVLRLALEKEKSSYAFYQEMIKHTENPVLTRLLARLRDVELGHIQRIKHALEKITLKK